MSLYMVRQDESPLRSGTRLLRDADYKDQHGEHNHKREHSGCNHGVNLARHFADANGESVEPGNRRGGGFCGKTRQGGKSHQAESCADGAKLADTASSGTNERVHCLPHCFSDEKHDAADNAHEQESLSAVYARRIADLVNLE